jgi:hypothetical protein
MHTTHMYTKKRLRKKYLYMVTGHEHYINSTDEDFHWIAHRGSRRECRKVMEWFSRQSHIVPLRNDDYFHINYYETRPDGSIADVNLRLCKVL